MPKKYIDLTGQTFGEWSVIGYKGQGAWECRCSCGTTRVISGTDLRKGKSKSCGHVTNQVKDLVGKKFGEWTVLEYLGERRWLCKCSCGAIRDVDGGHLRGGYSTSCGHQPDRFIDMTGKVFGELTVIEYCGNRKWKCKCSCGKVIEVLGASLRSGHTKSCGHNTNAFKDISGQRFGLLTAIEYLGDDKWECLCDCGNSIVTSGRRLRIGGVKSCGCSSGLLSALGCLQKYGDVSSKINNTRTLEQIYAVSSSESMLDVIKEFPYKPAVYELEQRLNIGSSATLKYIHKYGLEDYVDIGSNESKYEYILIRLINKLSNNKYRIIKNDRQILNGKELDIYIPELKLAIEFNGSLWHSDRYRDAKFHQEKTLRCRELGIRLIHIFEYEWADKTKREKIIDIISSSLNINNRVFARNTIVKEIETDVAKRFLDMYHLQGYTQASISIGCYKDTELVGIMTFGKPRFTSKYEYEMIRMCTIPNTTIVGGASKMFKYFLKHYNPQSIVSYANLAKFDGSVYKQMGFVEAEYNSITEPNYIWISKDCRKVLTRYQTQKHKLIEKGLGTENESESDIMKRLGYSRIFDSGNLKFEWFKNS